MRLYGTTLKRVCAMAAAVAALISLTACQPLERKPQPTATPTATAGPITVVASINQWGSLASEIGGSDVAVTSILNSVSVDAHDFEPKTSDFATLQKASIVVSNGAGYDNWATKSLSKNAQSVSAAETVGAMDGDNPHLWFSKDARKGMAAELAEAFTKERPAKKKAFANRLKQWNLRETALESSMKAFGSTRKTPTYAASEAVAYYLMSDMGFKDLTPTGYAQSVASSGEPAPADLKDFQELLEKRRVDMLVNNVQEPSDTSAALSQAAKQGDVPVLDVSEQMPKDAQGLTSWIASIVEQIGEKVPTDEVSKTPTTPGQSSQSPSGSSSPSSDSSRTSNQQ